MNNISKILDVTVKDFKPWNEWKVDKEGQKWAGSNISMWLIDQSTERRYGNESKGCVRFKSFLLVIGTPIVHSIAAVVNIAYRALRVATFYHFWRHECSEHAKNDIKEYLGYNFERRLEHFMIDFCRILTQIPILIFLELSALYGFFTPYNGRKLYASFERAQYGDFILAPCFQPEFDDHLLRGDVGQRNAW